MALVALGPLGALVSVSVNQLSGTRRLLAKRLIGTGSVIYGVGTIALLIVGLAAVPLALVFLLAALSNAIMIAWVVSRPKPYPDREPDHRSY